jgi:hypothetical protein
MAKTILIPSSIEEAVERLSGIEELLTAKDWERAVIVSAFTYDAGRGGDQRSNARQRALLHTEAEFARLGLKGLSDRKAVHVFRLIVKEATDNGEMDAPVPGERVKLPEREFPATRTGTDGYSTVEGAANTLRRVAEKHGSAPFIRATRQDPKVHDAAQEAVRDKNTRDFHDLVRRNQEEGDTGSRLRDAADLIRPTDAYSALARVHQITVVLRSIEGFRPHLNKKDRKEVADALYEAGDRVRMLADAFATQDIDAELQSILAQED